MGKNNRELQCPNKILFKSVRFEVFTAVTMKNSVLWDVTPCGSWENWRFMETYRLHHQGNKTRLARNISSNYQSKHAAKKYYSLITANVVPISPILETWWWRRYTPLKRRLQSISDVYKWDFVWNNTTVNHDSLSTLLRISDITFQ
jgi:hypothetical protein